MSQTSHEAKVAIYARVSTKDKQDVENQLQELRLWTEKMDYKIYREYIDTDQIGRNYRIRA